MKIPKPVTVDFETWGIEERPAYPPLPCGVSIKWPGQPARYYAFGHRVGNNCSWGEATAALAKAYAHPDGVLCQNGKFDVDVAEVHLGLPIPRWQDIHDTMFLIFLDDPHQNELGLKPTVQRLFGEDPNERDAVIEWLVEHQPVPGIKISRSKQSDHYAMKYLPLAPGDLVGEYANDDTSDTERVFNHLYAKTVEREMLVAYDRERRLMPILLRMERRGLPVDLPRLRDDVRTYGEWFFKLDQFLLAYLRAPDLNLDSGEQLMKIMESLGKVDLSVAPRTATGRLATSKEALLAGVSDKLLISILTYRAQLKTCLNTFMENWLRVAESSGGVIYSNWNQVRGSGSGGTRTGRLSSNPNMQNLSNEFKPLFDHEKKGLPKLPKALTGLPPLPKVRSYVVAFKGEILCGRDFSSQELRVLAHFEDGSMRDGYVSNPKLDLHQYAADLITETTGIKITRKDAKTIAFSILYGSGIGHLAENLGCTVEQAKRLKTVYLGTFPGIEEIMSDLKCRSKLNQPLRTVGGREYYCEPPKIIDGRLRYFDYKLINYMIQGSSADQTKDAVIRFDERNTGGKLLLTVHDEILVSAPIKKWQPVMKVLKECMNDAGLDVPMLSDGEVGANWGAMTECE